MKTTGTVIKKFLILTASLCLLVATTGTSKAAVEATIIVNDWEDIPGNGKCSVREAVQAANENFIVDSCAAGSPSGTDLILVNDDLAHDYSLGSSGSHIEIKSSVKITGSSLNGVRINGNFQDRIFFINATGHAVTLENLTLKNGEATDVGIINDIGYGNSGGAIFNNS
ncbi:MAG: hypothetical protein EHM41_21795, partial [Chloroflexi bacterium]